AAGPIEQVASPGKGVTDVGELSDKSLGSDNAMGNFGLLFDEDFVIENCRWADDGVISHPNVAADPAGGLKLCLGRNPASQADPDSGAELAKADSIGSPGAPHIRVDGFEPAGITVEQRVLSQARQVVH